MESLRWRLGLGPPCDPGECSKNRVNDPFCLCRLLQTHRLSREKSPEPKKRGPVGLQNLGNTCYMNSYLQTLFHMLPVRRILFDWRFPSPDRREPGKRYDMASALQSLFARLQIGQETAIDPQELVDSAGLNVAEQQDVQEFAILFLEYLDQALAERKGEEKLQSFFTGKLRSVITCRECKAESSSESDFHDFALKTEDVTDVTASIREFFAPEKIDEYKCDKCQQNQTADKTIQLTSLPRYLNLHLLRYVYDRVNNVQRKLTHQVDFPQFLDLQPYLSADQIREWGIDGCCYELKAILIHEGGAHGGHYFARIHVPTDGRWYTFNDADVTPYDLENYTEDARGAYLLVYEKSCDVEKKAETPNIPPSVFPEESVSALRQQADVLRVFGSVTRFLSALKVKPRRRVVWLPVDWLATVARAIQTKKCDHRIEAPDMRKNICALHDRVTGIGGLKAVDAFQANQLIVLLGIQPRPRLYELESFCDVCNFDTNGNRNAEPEEEGNEDDEQEIGST